MSVFTNPASSAPEQAGQYTAAILDLLGDRNPIDVLRQTPGELARILTEMSDDEIGRREAPGKWSVRMVLQHLADGELVGAYRIRMILAHDRPVITAYDQDLFASRLGYEEGDAKSAFERFRVLRESNVWLVERASPADLKRVCLHAERGEESLERLIALYAGHDLLHQRQIERIRAAMKS